MDITTTIELLINSMSMMSLAGSQGPQKFEDEGMGVGSRLRQSIGETNDEEK